MPDDPILDTPPATETPEGDPTPDASVSTSDFESLKEQVSGTAAAVQSLTETLQAAMNTPTPVAPEPEAEPTSVDDTLRELTTDPEALIKRISEETVNKARVDTFDPAIQQVYDAQHNQIMAVQKSEVDGEYGTGTWDEKFLPHLQPVYAQLRTIDPAKLADPNYIKANVGVIANENRVDLAKARTDLVKTTEEAKVAERNEIINHLPAGSIRRTAGTTGEVTQEMTEFLARVEKGGGGRTDGAEFEKHHTSGNSLREYLEATGETKKLEAIFGE